MARLVTMPQLGSTMEEGTILQWNRKEGDTVKQGEPLLEIETDKASITVEAENDGVLRKILIPAESSVPIRTPIAIIGETDEDISSFLSEAPIVSETPPSASNSKHAAETPDRSPSSQSNIAVSPRALRLAEEKGVAISEFSGKGSGPKGRIIERDIIAFIEREDSQIQAHPARITPLAARMADDLGVDLNDLATGLPGSRVRSEDVLRQAAASRSSATSPQTSDFQVFPYTGMRRRIAENVSRSAFTAPHVTLTTEVDMSASVDLRKELLKEVERVFGVRLSYTDMLVKAAAQALQEHPRMNAALEGEEIRLHKSKNIGLAVALEEGLVVPVLRNVENLSLGQVACGLKPLIERARTGRFTPDDVSGGTFTITNLGAFDIDMFDPVLVPGQAGILGVGRIMEKPIVMEGQIVIRSMMHLCLSFDHRQIDGAPAARFLQRLKSLLEHPLTLMI